MIQAVTVPPPQPAGNGRQQRGPSQGLRGEQLSSSKTGPVTESGCRHRPQPGRRKDPCSGRKLPN